MDAETERRLDAIARDLADRAALSMDEAALILARMVPTPERDGAAVLRLYRSIAQSISGPVKPS